MENDKVSAIMQYVKKGQSQPRMHYIRTIKKNSDGSTEIVDEKPIPLLPFDFVINMVGNGVPCAHSEEEVYEREGITR